MMTELPHARDANVLDKRTMFLTVAAMLAFAANSILCRLALADGSIDPASFTLIRVASGAVALALLLAMNKPRRREQGTWQGAAALIIYAAAFSYGYVSLTAGVGAFLLFGAVQVTMVVSGLLRGDRLSVVQICGFALAITGLAVLAMRGAFALNIVGAVLMIASGVAWGIYSLGGRRASSPLAATMGNFLRALPIAAIIFAFGAVFDSVTATTSGLIYAVLSGAAASGLGYAIWYTALPGLSPAQGASVQLSVPVITAVLGAILLGEALTVPLALSACAILIGILLVIFGKRAARG